MTKFPEDDDQKLVEFIRKYQPIAPVGDGESQLMNLIAKNPLSLKQKSRRLLWILPPILATVGFLLWGGKPQFQLAPSVKLASDANELETFMINSWQDSLDYPPTQTTELTDYEYSVFNPIITQSAPEKSVSSP